MRPNQVGYSMTNRAIRIFITTIVFSTILAFGAHVLIRGWEDQISASYGHLFELAKSKDKFSFIAVFSAGVTALLPVAIGYWILTVIWHRVPGREWWAKGLIYSGILLILKSELVRAPIMRIVMGLPPWLVGVSQLDVWIPNIILGVILAYGIHKSKGVAA